MDLLNRLFSNFGISKRWLVYLVHASLIYPGIVWAQQQTPANVVSAQQKLQKARDLFYEREYQSALDIYLLIFDTQNKLDNLNLDEVEFNIGRCYAKLGKDNESLKHFRKIISRDPTGSYATQSVYQIGNLFVVRYQYDVAGRTCQKIAERYTQTRSGAIASYLAGQYWHYADQDEKAVQAYQKFLINYPKSPYRSNGLQSLVQIWIKTEQFKIAEKLLTDLLATDESSIPNQKSELSELMADLYKAQGRSDLALKLYQSALNESPKDTNLLKKLGELYVEIGNQEQALHVWSQIATSNPNQYYRFQQMADIYVSNQLYDQAIAAYQSALKLNPTSAYLYAELAGVYKIKGQIELMVDFLLQALLRVDYDFNSRDIILQNFNNIYEGDRQHQLLREVIAKLEAMPAISTKQLLTLAEIHFYDQNFDQSLNYFQLFSRQYPENKGKLLQKYAQILDRNGNLAADQFYQVLIDVYPNSLIRRQSRLKLANRYQKSNNWEQALAQLQRIENKDILVQLQIAGLLLHDAYHFSEAEKLYQKLSQQPLPVRYQAQVNLGLAETFLLSNRLVAARSILQPIADGVDSRSQAQAIKLIGDSHLFEHNFESAQEAYQRVTLLLTDHTSEALTWLVRINTNSSSDETPLIQYVEGEYLKRKGQIDEAVAHCQLAIKQYPQSLIVDDLLWMLGDLYTYRKQYKNAIKTYRRVMESGSGLAIEAQARVADIYQFDLRNSHEAFRYYTQLVNNHGDSVVAAYAQQQADVLRPLIVPTKLKKTSNF